MKRRILLGFLILVLMQTASAYMTIDFEAGQILNRGEQIETTGYILRETAEQLTLNFELNCENAEYQMPSKTITTVADSLYQFEMPAAIIPADAQKECSIVIKAMSGQEQIDEVQSPKFTITSEIDATFQINPLNLQRGGTFTIYGTAFKAGGEPVDGMADIYLSQQNQTLQIGTASVSEGKTEYQFSNVQIPAGKYNVDIIISDIYGNEKSFFGVGEINVVDQVSIMVKTDKTKPTPEETVLVSGTVNTILQEEIETGTIQLAFLGSVYSVIIKDGKFEQEITIPKDVTSGKQTISLAFEDEIGNKGSTDIIIYVTPIPTTLELDVTPHELIPGDQVLITPTVYDQSGAQTNTVVTVTIDNAEGKTIFLDTFEGTALSFNIPAYSDPGNWKVKAVAKDLKIEKAILIKEYQDLYMEIINETLYVHNTGNIMYKEPITVNFNGEEYEVEKKIKIGPNQTIAIDLAEEVPSTGDYQVQVTGNAVMADAVFDSVHLEGKGTGLMRYLYSMLAIVGLAGIMYMVVTKTNFNVSDIRVPKIPKVRMGRRRSRVTPEQKARVRAEIMEKKAARPKQSSNMFSREESIDDFKSRMLKDVEAAEAKMKAAEEAKKQEPPSATGSYLAKEESESQRPTSMLSKQSEEKKDNKGAGMFGMFD